VSGGVWDDISTTPKPCGLSTPNALGGLGQSGVKRPSGLHNQVWNAEEEQVEEEGEEEDEDEEEEEDEFEDGWNFPGSLNTQRDHAASAAKFGFGASSAASPFSAMEKKHMVPPSSMSAWGFSTTTPSTTTTTTRTAPSHPRSTSASAFASRKHQVTMEEIPDESEYPSPHHHHHHHHHQHSLGRSSNSLAYDSRTILEPKPTKPSSMLDDVIQFGSKSGTFISSIINTNTNTSNEDEEEEGKEEMDYHSVVEKHHPTFPRVVNPSSNPNANIPDIDPAVLQRAALQMRQGEERFGVAHAHAHANGAGLTTGTVKPKAKKKPTRVSLNRRRPPCGGDDEDQEEDGEEEDNEDVKPGFWTRTDTRKRWEESEEDLEREQGILNSQQKLKDLFGSGSGSGGGGGGVTTNTKKPSVDKIVIPNPETDMPPLRGQALRALKEKEEAEEREREESLRQHQEQQQQREAQEQDKKVNVVHPPSPPKAEKEKEGASKSTTTGGKGRAKKGKGKR